MNPLSVGLGLALGAGVLLVARGLSRLSDKTLDPEARRKGYWTLNAGLALIAGSVVVFSRFSAG